MDFLDLYRLLKWQSRAYGPVFSYNLEKKDGVITVKLAHTVKNEIEDRLKATAEGKAYWQYVATVHANGLTFELYWFVWQATDEPKEFLRDLGLRWDKEELKEGSTPEAGKVQLYKDGKLVGELQWLLVSPQ